MEKDNPPFKDALAEEAKNFERFYLWLSDNMPKNFFEEIPGEWTALITHNLMNFKAQNYFSLIHVKNALIVLCLDSPKSDLKILETTKGAGILNYHTYVSKTPLPITEHKNAFLKVAALTFTEFSTPEDGKLSPLFLKELSSECQEKVPLLIEKALAEDTLGYFYEKDTEGSLTFLIAWKNIQKSSFFYKLARVLYTNGYPLKAIFATYLPLENFQNLIVLSFKLDIKEISDESLKKLIQDIQRIKFSSVSKVLEKAFLDTNLLDGAPLDLLSSIHYFVHQVLVHADEHLYSLESVEEGLTRHPDLTLKLVQAFVAKLEPQKGDLEKYAALKKEFFDQLSKLDTGTESHDLRRKTILKTGMEFVDAVLKTNYFQVDRTAISFRLSPTYLDKAPIERKKIFPELPFGIFFIKGLHFIGFHVRFRDLARGGLRTVFPLKKEKIDAELPSMFLECYNLAYTQNKKNKDIPEGGSKGICFLLSGEWIDEEIAILRSELTKANASPEIQEETIARFEKEARLEFLHESQRSYITSLLSLINCHPDGHLKDSSIVDLLKKPEYLYLGPDENMHDSMIEWIAAKSREVGYKPGGAFISGKPALGINHKEYGVTSLGVHVYIEALLRFLSLDQNPTFSLKMTGGPDGDVAGNEMLNLYRYCNGKAKLLAVTDVSGTIFDPKGLDLESCAKLFHEAKSIRFYPTEKLSLGGFLLDRQTQKQQSAYDTLTLLWKNQGTLEKTWLNTNETNSLFRHNVHQTKAEIFVPCGGRPRTLRESNYDEFLDENGDPTSKAIVEGANLYLTQQARRALEEKGVLIIKDSSANKGGVICSSFEILAGLALTEAEFLTHKKALTDEILERIKLCSQREADLLLSTFKEEGRFLTDISEEISERINLFTDQLLLHLETITLSKDPSDPLTAIFLDYCPAILRNEYQERMLKEIPENHKKAIIACHIAARLVYKRGLKWMPSIVDILPVILEELKDEKI